ncbi:phage tail protein [Buttiauxella sp. 3AFRM03]|uniref:tail protein X n=1 Tax=Buttiauxella sp. 3AFRM03 TaxID=2479367 RepID=UPI000EF81F9C|nr:tail protein X [Buttiauxella sp. 3AFRM03]AYN26399.1 phage tail protein [Buttiauxella sp. 3AFRM03]
MVTIYITRDGDILDEICWRFYGDSKNLIAVFNANPGLAEWGNYYEAGIEIKLPVITDEPTIYTPSLW